MSSLWTNLLFMHGHITDLELARRLASPPPDDRRTGGKRVKAQPPSTATKAPAMQPALVGAACLRS
ncbi:hypothetical protein ACXU4B_10465 [Dyella soli]|uniref:Uncharacterized protein n=1 Tax=Dyella soli TaxID=522319 RepID=A0A4R0YGS5_9GAMM|nr:hypothetical protein [Dyella soli]TCI07393.1 hypothetical protein EZM97_32960 [Dyella soli]